MLLLCHDDGAAGRLLAGMSGYAFCWLSRFRGCAVLMVGIPAITGVLLLTNRLALYQMGVVLRKANLLFYDDRSSSSRSHWLFLLLSVDRQGLLFDAIPREPRRRR